MGTMIYILLDILDTSAIVCLMSAIFNYPLREYLKEYALTAAIIAVSSWVLRIYGDWAAIDTISHVVILVLCMFFLMRVKLYRCAHIVIVGTAIYFLTQLLVVSLFQFLHWVVLHEMTLASGSGVYLIQITSDLLAFLISCVIGRYSLGITKYVRPPHNFFVTEKMSRTKLTVILFTCAAFALINMGFYAYQNQDLYPAAAILLVVSMALVYLSYRRDNKRGNSY